jgi:hypothetical protein
MFALAIPLTIGVLVAVLLFPMLKWQHSQIEKGEKGFKAKINMLFVLVVEFVLFFGGISLVLHLFRDLKPEDKVTPFLLYEVPSLGIILYFLIKYLAPASMRAAKK